MTTAKSKREQWKSFERTVARLVGGVRVPVTGRARGSAADVNTALWAIEVKHRKALPAVLTQAMAQARASCRQEQKPLVVLGQNGKDARDALVCLRLRDFVELV